MICDTSCHQAIRGIYDTLTYIGEDREAHPFLLDSFEPNATFDQWTFVARDGITFHDGTPFDADAMMDHFERMRASTLVGNAIQAITDVQKVDDMTIQISMDTPWVDFPIYFAAQPFIYVNGIVTLVPKDKRARAREVLDEIGLTLSKWLFGKMCSMLLVGAFTAIGLTILGVPLALILGIIAGLLDFIPYLGPLMAGVPGVLIALTISPELAMYTVALFGFIQLAEGYLLQPLVEKKTVALPPALTITMQVLLGALFGLAGVALATPLTAVLAVLVSMLYVQDVLGDNVMTPSELSDQKK